MAIQVVAPPDTILVGDTIAIHVRVLNRSGDSIVGAVATLTSLAPDTLGVDNIRVAVFGKLAGHASYIALTSTDLPSAPLQIVVK